MNYDFSTLPSGVLKMLIFFVVPDTNVISLAGIVESKKNLQALKATNKKIRQLATDMMCRLEKIWYDAVRRRYPLHETKFEPVIWRALSSCDAKTCVHVSEILNDIRAIITIHPSSLKIQREQYEAQQVVVPGMYGVRGRVIHVVVRTSLLFFAATNCHVPVSCVREIIHAMPYSHVEKNKILNSLKRSPERYHVIHQLFEEFSENFFGNEKKCILC